MEMVALSMLGIGSALGLRFRVLVLLPVILLGLIVYTACGLAQGTSDLVHHADKYGGRDVPAVRIFGRRPGEVRDPCRTDWWNQEFPTRAPLRALVAPRTRLRMRRLKSARE